MIGDATVSWRYGNAQTYINCNLTFGLWKGDVNYRSLNEICTRQMGYYNLENVMISYIPLPAMSRDYWESQIKKTLPWSDWSQSSIVFHCELHLCNTFSSFGIWNDHGSPQLLQVGYLLFLPVYPANVKFSKSSFLVVTQKFHLALFDCWQDFPWISFLFSPGLSYLSHALCIVLSSFVTWSTSLSLTTLFSFRMVPFSVLVHIQVSEFHMLPYVVILLREIWQHLLDFWRPST